MSLLDTIKGWFGSKPKLPSAPKPPSGTDVIYLRENDLDWNSLEKIRAVIGSRGVLTGKTLNLKGCVLDGSKLKHPSNSQNEDAPGVVIDLDGFTLQNGWSRDIPGGIIVKSAGNSFERLKFIEIGEDALSTTGKSATGIRISSCEFWNDGNGDKSVQLNQALGADIRNTKVVGGITGIRVQKDSYKTAGVTCYMKDVEFIGCETGINVAGKATVRLSGGKFTSVKKKWVTGPGAKVVSV